MLNSIFGCSQEVAYMLNLDLIDVLLMYYVMLACGSPDMYHMVVESDFYDEPNIVLTWLSHKKIVEDLPILRLSEPTIRNRLSNLKSIGFIVSETVHNRKGRGSRTYYGLSNSALSLFKRPNQIDTTTSLKNDVKTMTTSFENDTVTRPRHSKMTPDKKLINDNILNNDKEIKEKKQVSSPSTKDNPFSEKPKKVNVYDKCQNEIYKEEYGFSLDVADKLKEYLPVRFNKTTVPPSYNNWVSLLRKLVKLSRDEDVQIKIIQKSIDCDWASFFELKENGYSYNKRENVFGEYNTSSEHVSEEAMINGHFSTDKY